MDERKLVSLCFIILCLAWSYEDLFIQPDMLEVIKDSFLTGIAIAVYRRIK